MYLYISFPFYRWVSSHYISMLKIFTNLEHLLNNLQSIAETKGKFGEGARNDADDLYDFLSNKNAIMHIVFNFDVQALFKVRIRQDQSSKIRIDKYIFHAFLGTIQNLPI